MYLHRKPPRTAVIFIKGSFDVPPVHVPSMTATSCCDNSISWGGSHQKLCRRSGHPSQPTSLFICLRVLNIHKLRCTPTSFPLGNTMHCRQLVLFFQRIKRHSLPLHHCHGIGEARGSPLAPNHRCRWLTNSSSCFLYKEIRGRHRSLLNLSKQRRSRLKASRSQSKL